MGGGYIYFVCDKKEFASEIMKKIHFHNLDFDFISSDRITLRKEVEQILKHSSAKWRRVAYALLTPFTHAIKNKFQNIYNIDADDLELLISADKAAQALYKAEEAAKENKIDCFSYDMHCSWTFGVAWGFGIAYVKDPNKCITVLRDNLDWMCHHNAIKNEEGVLIDELPNGNIDGFFNFLRLSHQLKCSSFYIENCHLVHMPDVLLDRWLRLVKHSQGNISFPLLQLLYNEKKFYSMPIASECHKIDIQLDEADFYNYMRGEKLSQMNFNRNVELKRAKKLGMVSQDVYNKYIDE